MILNLARRSRTSSSTGPHPEQALLSAYLMATRKSQVAIACLDGQMRICNPEAAALLSDADQNNVWEHLVRRGFRTPATFSPLELSTGRVLMPRGRPVRQDSAVIGAVVEAYEPQTLSGRAPRESLPPARPALGGLVGTSDRWANLCTQGAPIAAEGGGVLAVGEPGVGKLAVLRAIFVDEPVTVIECSLVMVGGAQEWLSALRTRLGDPTGVVVLRHLHLLDAGVAQAVCGILDTVDEAPRLAATADADTDLFAPLVGRFEVHRLEVPALRHRLDDLPLLLDALSSRVGGTGGGPRWLPETVHVLADQTWGDNVRGLGAVVRRVLRTRKVGVVAVTDLPDGVAVRPDVRRPLTQLQRLERQEIIETLSSLGGNKLLAAKKLNLARSTLYRKMAALQIRDVSPRQRPRP